MNDFCAGEAKRRYLAGDSSAILARRYGLRPDVLLRALREQGVVIRSSHDQRRINRYQAAMRAAFLYHNGGDTREIARYLGLSPYTVADYLNECGYRGVRP